VGILYRTEQGSIYNVKQLHKNADNYGEHNVRVNYGPRPISKLMKRSEIVQVRTQKVTEEFTLINFGLQPLNV